MSTVTEEPLSSQGKMQRQMDFAGGKPGVYGGVPAITYHTLDAASASRLNELRRSPMHARYAIDHPDDDTAATLRGTACHACLLEPAEFASRFVLGPDVKLNTKEGKTRWEEFCIDHQDKTVVRGAEGEKLIGMHRAVWDHPAARRYLSEPGPFEESIVFENRGVLCKARLDHRTLRGIIFDLKTTRDASEEAFPKAIKTYGYHRQGAHYLLAAQKHGLDAKAFGIIAVESEPPHGVCVHILTDRAIQQGDREMQPLYFRWAECRKTGRWPGYSEEAVFTDLPPYAQDRQDFDE
jgi:hypothetical protein